MTRPTRMLLLVGAVGLLGVVALALMADRYGRMAELRSVAEIEGASGRGQSLPDLPGESRHDPPVDAAAGVDGPGADEPTTMGGEVEALGEVEAFVRIRSKVKAVIDSRPWVAQQMLDPATGEWREDLDYHMSKRARALLANIQREKMLGYQATGLTEQDYTRLRDAFRGWHDSVEIDPELRQVFESRRAELEPLHLGKLEPYDG